MVSLWHWFWTQVQYFPPRVSQPDRQCLKFDSPTPSAPNYFPNCLTQIKTYFMGLFEDISAAAPYFSLCEYLKRLYSSSSVAKYTRIWSLKRSFIHCSPIDTVWLGLGLAFGSPNTPTFFTKQTGLWLNSVILSMLLNRAKEMSSCRPVFDKSQAATFWMSWRCDQELLGDAD